MKVLVTGASGFIGTPLCRRLAESGHEVIAMYCNRIPSVEFQHPGITLLKADVTSPSDLRAAVGKCEMCFHLAAMARPWAQNLDQYQQVNVNATQSLFELALKGNVHRVLFTSSASVFGPASAANPINETSSLATRLDSEYERSKLACEASIFEFRKKGLDIVTAYPTRVYGPGPLNPGNTVTRIIRQFNDGNWRFIPGDGTAIGNYVFIDDVVEGHIRAMFQGPPNEKYLLAGENLSFNQIVAQLQRQTGRHPRLFHVPRPVLLAYARFQVVKAQLFGSQPSITPPFVRKYFRDWYVEGSNARALLAFNARPFDEGLANTLAWLESQEEHH